MTFKEFVSWCNQRACDGCWGMLDAMVCIDIVNTIRKELFWRREKVWKRDFENRVVDEIIIPIENKIKEVYGR